jgi:hypothetical protein
MISVRWRANYELTTFIPNPESEIARYRRSFNHYDRQRRRMTTQLEQAWNWQNCVSPR